MRRRVIIKDGNVCIKRTGEFVECPSRPGNMQGSKMPPCRVNCALLQYYRTNDDYRHDRDRNRIEYVNIVTCGDDRLGMLEECDVTDDVRSNCNYEPIEEEPTSQNIPVAIPRPSFGTHTANPSPAINANDPDPIFEEIELPEVNYTEEA